MKVEFLLEQNEVTLVFKKVKQKEPLTQKEAKEVSVFLKAYHKQIINKWNEVFIYHQKVESEVIKEKIRKPD